VKKARTIKDGDDYFYLLKFEMKEKVMNQSLINLAQCMIH